MNPTPPPDRDMDLSRRVAHVLDTLIKIPGTKLKFGLDPIIGLIPGVGDAIAAAMGSMILAEAIRRGVPRLLMMRMAGNMLINAAVGAVPVVGDLFSAWFRSNSRNYAMLKAWQSGAPKIPAAPQTKWVVAGFVLLLLLLAGFCVLAFWLLGMLWRWVN